MQFVIVIVIILWFFLANSQRIVFDYSARRQKHTYDKHTHPCDIKDRKTNEKTKFFFL